METNIKKQLTPDGQSDELFCSRRRVDDTSVDAFVGFPDVLYVQVPFLYVRAVDADTVIIRHRQLIDGQYGGRRVLPDHLTREEQQEMSRAEKSGRIEFCS